MSARLGLALLLLAGCYAAPQTVSPDGGTSDGGVHFDAGADLTGCNTFACLGVLAYGNKSVSNGASSCVGYKVNLRPSPVCEGCACVAALSDCVITASTWADATCSTMLVDRKTVNTGGRTTMSTYQSIAGYAKVDGATTTCAVDTTVKGGPAYASDDAYICNYFGPCSDLDCAASSEASCLLLVGNVECPGAFPNKEVAFTSVDDRRTCTCDCAGAPGSCAAQSKAPVAVLHSLANDTQLSTDCKAHGNTGGSPPNNVRLLSLGVLAPTCVSAGKSVSGTIEVRGYKTVCCR